ncbi:MAG TPA: DUF2207 domain-containing protein [Solidesulfovibrio magneticus]|nr:DUF2207 domain-containing protein [Solidesulfovibrio magneticus]
MAAGRQAFGHKAFSRRLRAFCSRGVLLAALALLVVLAGPAAAQTERILSFDSQVTIAANGDLTVVETLRVMAAGQSIRQGIVREFPTRYDMPGGKTVTTGFKVLRVRRDGRGEDYHTETAGNGVKVYMGKKGRLLDPGEHTYELTYATDDQIGQFADFDELYWNVTGNGWRLPIDQASTTIFLPPGAQPGQWAAYTGPAGAKGRDFTAHTGPGTFFCQTTKPLPPGSGLTVAVSFPKGFVTLPTPTERILTSRAFHLAAAGLVVVTVFFVVAWLLVGRDPARGVTIPLFSPPDGVSAPGARFLRRMGYDDKTFAAGVVEMAVAGGAVIEDDDGTYIVGRGKKRFPQNSWQAGLIDALLGGAPAVRLEQENHQAVRAAQKALRDDLKDRYEGSHFQVNRVYFLVGVALCLLVFALVALNADEPEMAGMTLAWLGVWSFGVAALTIRAMQALAKAKARPRFLSIVGAAFACLFALPFVLGELAALAFLSIAVSWPAAACLAAIAVEAAIFRRLLKAPTKAGRRVMDALEGFRLYLRVGEGERLNLLTPPERTPELFERYLPYALALDVENDWANQFADVLARAAAEGYQPVWYVGQGWSSGDFGGFAGDLGSGFSSAISSSSTAPGSSSGSGGGGSSGGGGGGGGGGGW